MMELSLTNFSVVNDIVVDNKNNNANNTTAPDTWGNGLIYVTAALQNGHGDISSFSSPALPLYHHVLDFATPTIVQTDCLRLYWQSPEHPITSYEILVNIGRFTTHYTVPSNTTSFCLSATASSPIYVPSPDGSGVIALKKTVQVRAVSPAGVSNWSALVEVPTSDPINEQATYLNGSAVGGSSDSSLVLTKEIVIPCIAFVLLAAAAVLVIYRRMKNLPMSFLNEAMVELRQYTHIVKPRMLDIASVKFLQVIGTGKFGQVHKGILRCSVFGVDAVVAIKSLKDGFPDEAKRSFAAEACIMVSNTLSLQYIFVCVGFYWISEN